jgi:hypothetical protein
VVEHLRDRDYRAPLRELRFAVSGDRIYFQHHDGLWEGDEAPDQVVLYQVLDLEAIKARIRRSARPSREHEAGHVERRRGLLGRRPCSPVPVCQWPLSGHIWSAVCLTSASWRRSRS